MKAPESSISKGFATIRHSRNANEAYEREVALFIADLLAVGYAQVLACYWRDEVSDLAFVTTHDHIMSEKHYGKYVHRYTKDNLA